MLLLLLLLYGADVKKRGENMNIDMDICLISKSVLYPCPFFSILEREF